MRDRGEPEGEHLVNLRAATLDPAACARTALQLLSQERDEVAECGARGARRAIVVVCLVKTACALGQVGQSFPFDRASSRNVSASLS